MDRKKYDADEAAVGKSMEVLSQGKTNVAVFLCVCVFWLVGWLLFVPQRRIYLRLIVFGQTMCTDISGN